MARNGTTEPFDLDVDTLQTWLEWAGSRLLALPAAGLYPTEPHAAWPAYSLDKYQVLEFRGRLRQRSVAPPAHEIPMIDEILILPKFAANRDQGRVLQLRSLVNPITNRHKLNWAAVGKIMHTNWQGARRLHQLGLTSVVRRAPAELVCRIGAFFEAT